MASTPAARCGSRRSSLEMVPRTISFALRANRSSPCKARHLDGARIVLSAVTDAWPRGWDSARPAHLTTEAHPD